MTYSLLLALYIVSVFIAYKHGREKGIDATLRYFSCNPLPPEFLSTKPSEE
jgi:hypothetical protein